MSDKALFQPHAITPRQAGIQALNFQVYEAVKEFNIHRTGAKTQRRKQNHIDLYGVSCHGLHIQATFVAKKLISSQPTKAGRGL